MGYPKAFGAVQKAQNSPGSLTEGTAENLGCIRITVRIFLCIIPETYFRIRPLKDSLCHRTPQPCRFGAGAASDLGSACVVPKQHGKGKRNVG